MRCKLVKCMLNALTKLGATGGIIKMLLGNIKVSCSIIHSLCSCCLYIDISLKERERDQKNAVGVAMCP